MKACLFAGPTIDARSTSGGVKYLGPAMLGSVYRAVEAGYQRIGLVDGYLGNVPSVWHKEILHAIHTGVEVFGAASIGALRASELWKFGMGGVGLVFRLYRMGRLLDDDEVCVIHAPAEAGFRRLSEPMINIRLTFRSLAKRRVVPRAVCQTLTLRMKALHFSDRTLANIARHARADFGARASELVRTEYRRHYIDVKRSDALRLVQVLLSDQRASRRPATWHFPRTSHWSKQFESELSDIPTLPSS